MNFGAVETLATVVVSMIRTSVFVQVLVRIQRLIGVIRMADVSGYGTRCRVHLRANAAKIRRHIIIVKQFWVMRIDMTFSDHIAGPSPSTQAEATTFWATA